MSRTCKSPRKVLLTAWGVAKSALPEFSHKFSPKKFTQHQLFACLVLKEFLRLDYRKLAALLKDADQLANAIELEKIPHFTTFQKAADRFGPLVKAQAAERVLRCRAVLHLAESGPKAAQFYRLAQVGVGLYPGVRVLPIVLFVQAGDIGE